MEALLQKVSDASHIQIVWKGLWGFRSVSRYCIFDLFNFTPVKIQRTGRFQNVNVVYHSHHNAHISCVRTLRSLQNPMHTEKRMIPRDIMGILDFPGRWNYLWPICHFFPVCLQRGQGGQVLTSLSLSGHVFCWPAKASHLDGEIALWQFINILLRWQGQLKTWLTFRADLSKALLPAIRFAAKSHYSILDIMLIGINMHDIQFKKDFLWNWNAIN